MTLWSDASDVALAAVFCNNGSDVSVKAWPADVNMHIFAREFLAHRFSLELVPRSLRSIGAGLDNTNCLSAIRRGHSASGLINGFLRNYFAYLESRGLRVASGFVPTNRQLADFPSRRQPLPHDFREYINEAPAVSFPPHFRVPPRN